MKPLAFIYWNLHKKCFSVKYQGRVIAYANRILAAHVEFRISEAGRQRVLREKRKNVHAYMVCDLNDLNCDSIRNERSCSVLDWPVTTDLIAKHVREDGEAVRYNPYECGQFTSTRTGNVVFASPMVYGNRDVLNNRPAVWALRRR